MPDEDEMLAAEADSDASEVGDAETAPASDSAADASMPVKPDGEAASASAAPDVVESDGAPDETPVATPQANGPVNDLADAVLAEAVGGGLTWIPFASYLGLWIVLAGLSAYLLYGATPEQPARWMPEYVPLLWSGVALTALGPVLSTVVWLVARARRPKSERRGLFASAMTRGALVAFFGVAIWVATLFVLELVAAGGTL